MPPLSRRSARRLGAAVLGLALIVAASGAWPQAGDRVAAAPAPRPVAIPVGGGGVEPVVLDGDFYLPAGASASAPVPVVVGLHGFGGSKTDLRSDAERLTRAGFAVLLYSIRGFGRTGGAIALGGAQYDGADLRRAIDWLARQPEVLKDEPGDPRVGLFGFSLGGGISQLEASTDPRVDAVVPVISWHSLVDAFAPGGVVKQQWANAFFAAPAGSSAECPNFVPRMCAAFAATAAAGRLGPEALDLLDARSLDAAASGLNAPTLLVQGQTDTLFPLDQAAATAAGLRSRGVPVKEMWISGGHSAGVSSGENAHVASAVVRWFRRWLDRWPIDTGAPFEWAENGHWYGRSTPPAVVSASPAAGSPAAGGSASPAAGSPASPAAGSPAAGSPASPAAGSPAAGGSASPAAGSPASPAAGSRASAAASATLAADSASPAATVLRLALGPGGRLEAPATGVGAGVGEATFANPPGGQPAAFSDLPGIAGVSRLFASLSPYDLPGQNVSLDSAPLGHPLDVVGFPALALRLRSTARETVGFVKLYDVAPDGSTVLPGHAVTPFRRSGPDVIVDLRLAGIAHRFASGHRIRLVVASTDELYDNLTAPARYRVVLDGAPALALPVVHQPGAAGLPVGVLLALTVAALVIVGLVAGALARRSRHRAEAEIAGLMPAARPAGGAPAVGRAGGAPAVVGAGGAPAVVGAGGAPAVEGAGGAPAVGRAGGAPAVVGAGGAPAVGRAGGAPAVGRAGGAPAVGRAGGAPAVGRAGDPLILEGLTKRYAGGLTALDRLDLRVGAGQVYGLLGPNGAGKTTALRMALGLVRPTEGRAILLGATVRPGHPVLASVGSLIDGPGFVPHLSGLDNLKLWWQAGGRRLEEADLEGALAVADLGPAISRRVRTYSHGMSQRLALAQALLGRPPLLILDEPTDGLDPSQIREVRELVARIAAEGRTILLSSHLLAEVEQVCTHVGVLSGGRLIAAGTVAELIGTDHLAYVRAGPPDAAAGVLRRIRGVRQVSVDGPGVIVDLDGIERADLVPPLVAAGLPVAEVTGRRRLEDAFLGLIGEERT